MNYLADHMIARSTSRESSSGDTPVPSRSIKVLLVTNLYPTAEEPWYGCFVRDQIQDLVALGVDVRVLHFDGRRNSLNYVRAAREIRLRVTKEPFDLIHAHYGLSGAAAILQRRVPVVTTFHGSDCSGAVAWQRYISWLVARRSVPIFVSDEGRRMLGCPPAPIIPAGVDTELFSPLERHSARRQLGWQQNKRYVLLPGSRSVPTKRADLFDAVLAEARKAEPQLLGVSLEGFSREQTAFVLNAVDVVLMTSDHEGSPVALREALSCGTPVVSVAVGDVPIVLADLPGCGIFPRDPRALARGLIEALRAGRHPAFRQRAKRYSRRVTAERVATVYQDAIN